MIRVKGKGKKSGCRAEEGRWRGRKNCEKVRKKGKREEHEKRKGQMG